MNRLLTDLRLKWRIVLVALVPMLGLVVATGFLITERARQSAQMGRLADLAALAPQLSTVVHELQKERGISAGYIGSGGSEIFKARLSEQRAATDGARSTLKGTLEGMNLSAQPEHFTSALKAARGQLDQVETFRQAVDKGELKLGAMAKRYSNLISTLISLNEHMVPQSEEAQVASSISAWIALMQYKERMGIERAMGANGFGKGQFASEVHSRFVDLNGQQAAFLSTFNSLAPEEFKATFKSTITAEATAPVDALRAKAINSAYGGSIEGITGAAWFDAVTTHIDKVRIVELAAAESISTQAGRLGEAATLSLWAWLLLSVTLFGLALLVSTVMGRTITRPLQGVQDAMVALTSGDTEVNVEGGERGDEIGAMCRALGVFVDHARELDKSHLARQASDELALEERIQSIRHMADSIESEAISAVDVVNEEAQQMDRTASTLQTMASDMQSQASDASEAASRAMSQAADVSHSAQELSRSIDEISNQVTRSAQVSNEAVGITLDTRSQVQKLADSAREIGDVVSLINDIAEQTNLLALNATIEAARAGEAGKGFAVVADEVKRLASQTASATNDIRERISAIQANTQTAAGAMDTVSDTIGELGQIAQAIAASVEEQGAATRDISDHVQASSDSSQQVTALMARVTEAAGSTREMADHVGQASGGLSQSIDDMHGALVRIVRTSTEEADRRKHPRFDTEIKGRWSGPGGQSGTVTVEDISRGGARLKGDLGALKEGMTVYLSINGSNVPPLPSQVRGFSPHGAHLEFEQPVSEELLEFVARREAHKPAQTLTM